MRVLIFTLTVLFLTGGALGQQSEPHLTITKHQILDLAPRDKAPRISLQQALKVAEGFIEKEKINISTSYLFEAKWVQDDVGVEPKWRFWWVAIQINDKPTDDIRITVSMNGKAKLESRP